MIQSRASQQWPRVDKFTLLALLSMTSSSMAQLNLDLCAKFNTADMGRNTSIYQTNGLCSDFCRDDYAYAITQAESCWCSNFTPDESAQVGMAECDINCPAYPMEKCGGKGLFGYVELNGHLPSGTQGPPTQTGAVNPLTTTTKVTKTETVQATITAPPSDSSSVIQTTSSSEIPSSTTSFQTITTDGGVIITVTVAPTDGSQAGSKSSGPGTGAIVGIVVGVLGLVLIAAGLGIFWFLKRRKRTPDEGYRDDPSVRADSSDRMGSARPEMSAMGAIPPAATAQANNRNSALQIDPRMDPFKQGLYVRGSHESINTICDEQDYSRRILRATNPDP